MVHLCLQKRTERHSSDEPPEICTAFSDLQTEIVSYCLIIYSSYIVNLLLSASEACTMILSSVVGIAITPCHFYPTGATCECSAVLIRSIYTNINHNYANLRRVAALTEVTTGAFGFHMSPFSACLRLRPLVSQDCSSTT
jgi:hypothetical protein